MAKLMKIGDYANTSEQWAAEYLARRLPDAWTIYTNLILPLPRRQPEIDMLVIAESEVVLIEVKGFSGKVDILQTGVFAHTPGNRQETRLLDYNPVARIMNHAKRLASYWETHFLTAGSQAPWFRGVVFVTGNNGLGLELDNGEMEAYGPEAIVNNLLQPLEENPQPLPGKKIRLLEEILSLRVPPAHLPLAIQNFKVQPAQPWDRDFERREAVSDLAPGLQFDLRVANLAETDALESPLKKKLQREAGVLTSLSPTPGIQRTLGIFETEGPLVILPLVRPPGKPVSSQPNLSPTARMEIAVQLTKVLATARKQQFVHGGLTEDDLWWDNSARLLTVCGWGRVDSPQGSSDVFFLRKWIRNLGECQRAAAKTLRTWAKEKAEKAGGLEAIECLQHRLEEASSGAGEAQVDEGFELKPGQKIDDSLQLVQWLGSGTTGDAWLARHLVGRFDCVLKFMQVNEENQQRRAEAFIEELEKLHALYHPNLVRVYDAKILSGQDLRCLILEYCKLTLRDRLGASEKCQTAEIVGWLRDGLNALQFLHANGCHHGDLWPGSIGLTAERAYLLDLGFILRGTPKNQRYRSPYPESSPAFNDLYALVLCLWEALAGYPFPGQVPEPLGTDWQPGEPEIGLPEVPWFKMAAILCGKGPDPASHDYSEWFGV